MNVLLALPLAGAAWWRKRSLGSVSFTHPTLGTSMYVSYVGNHPRLMFIM
jgi:hypothetical protein